MNLKFKALVLILVSNMIGTTIFAQSEMDQMVNSLLDQMTLDEKLGQLNLPGSDAFTTGQAKSSNIGQKIAEGKVGGLFNIKSVKTIKEIQKIAVESSRLKIPLIIGMDVIHGYETNFPIPLGLSCTWDMSLIQQSANIAAQEATADGINWTFSPMVDICRDPRWGRIAEGGGEDPFLGGKIAAAMVRGYQGEDLGAKNTMMACVKHFALYGGAEAGRDYNTVDMSRGRMYNDYFPPYKAAFDAGCGSTMASFNVVDGIPATGNRWLLTDVLRKQWGFNGFVVTDYTGINEMIDHGMGDLQECSRLALKAGVDMDMVGEGFLNTLKKSYEQGKVSMTDIDNAVKRILEAKYKLGLFEDPYRYLDETRALKEVYCQEHRDIARSISAQSFVLMKNDNQTLPLKNKGTIALIGPLVKNPSNMPGTWSVAAKHSQAIYAWRGLEELYGKEVNFLYAKGSNIDHDTVFEANAGMFGKANERDKRPKEDILAEAVEIANKADVIVLFIGESAEMSGECSSRTNIQIPQAQRELLTEMKKLGKPVVVVLFTGRPLVLTDDMSNADAMINVWFPGSEAGYAIADVLFGAVNPSGKLTTTFPRSVGQIPIFYAHLNTGRPLGNKEGKFEKFRSNYLDEVNDPLFPFGFGLSYTKFQYSDFKISNKELIGDKTLTASVTLKNTGNYDGAEVVQLYIRDLVASVSRPVKELKDFKKIFLKKGQSTQVEFAINTDDLKFYNFSNEYDWEEGDFEIMIGGNSKDLNVAKVSWKK